MSASIPASSRAFPIAVLYLNRLRCVRRAESNEFRETIMASRNQKNRNLNDRWLIPSDIPQQLLPTVVQLFVLFGRETLLGIPSLEAVVFRRRRETKFLFEDFLPFRTEQKIGKQQRRMRVVAVAWQGNAAGIGGV